MISVHRLQCAVIAMVVTAATASAQNTPPPNIPVAPPGNMWSHGTTLNVLGGAAARSGDRAALAGGAFGWEIRPWFALEGSGTWLDWGQSAHACDDRRRAARVSLRRPPGDAMTAIRPNR
jgi:hypothetical protein